MNKKDFSKSIDSHMNKFDLRFVIDKSNFINGWDSRIRELEKVTGKTLDQILKEK